MIRNIYYYTRTLYNGKVTFLQASVCVSTEDGVPLCLVPGPFSSLWSQVLSRGYSHPGPGQRGGGTPVLAPDWGTPLPPGSGQGYPPEPQVVAPTTPPQSGPGQGVPLRVPTFFLSRNSLTFPVFLTVFPDFFPGFQNTSHKIFVPSIKLMIGS